MDGVVFAKTSAGLEEIQQRRVQLHPRARALLILVDGKQVVTELISKFAAAPDLVHAHLLQLQDAGLIQAQAPVVPAEPIAPPASTGPISVQPMPPNPTPFSEPHTSSLPISVPPDESSRLMALYRIYTEIINSCFANRPGPYQKKLNQAVRIGDYIALGNEIILALNKTDRVPQAIAFKTQVRPLLK